MLRFSSVSCVLVRLLFACVTQGEAPLTVRLCGIVPKINRLLKNAGWRFFADGNGPANIQLEPSVKLTPQDLDSLGVDFEKAARGFIDFLLLDIRGFPLIVLEAKAEDKTPLVGKELARKYARSQNTAS